MRFSKMHFRKSKRALWIFTPSEMRLQRVKKTKFLKNSLRQEVVNSPQPFSSSCSSLFVLYSIGGFTYIPIDLQRLRPRRPRGLGALGSPGKRSWVARLAVRLASSPALINFSHSFRVFSLELGRRKGHILDGSDALRLNFEG